MLMGRDTFARESKMPGQGGYQGDGPGARYVLGQNVWLCNVILGLGFFTADVLDALQTVHDIVAKR